MKKLKQYWDMEKALEQKYRGMSKNVATLAESDFKDGKLDVCGYDRLKNQCDYIAFSEDITIKVPNEYSDWFKDSLEFLAVNELARIKRERRDTRIASIAFLLVGILFIGLSILLESLQRVLWLNIVIIVSWVFTWAAVEKWFFDRRSLRKKRRRILQILSAKILVIGEEDEIVQIEE